MMRTIFIFLFFVNCCSAQSIQWQRTFGGSEGEFGNCILPIDSGNFLICGGARSIDGDVSSHIGTVGTLDCWVLKIDSLGNILNSKCFGGIATDYGLSVIRCLDGGYLMNSYSTSQSGDVTGMHNHGPDVWLAKLNSNLEIEWESAFGSTVVEYKSYVVQTSDSGFIAVAATNGNDGDVDGNHFTGYDDIWVFKIDKNGLIQWQNCLGGTLYDMPGSLLSTNDNGVLICGTVSNGFGGNVSCISTFMGENVWFIKIDSSGQIEWDKCYGSSANDEGVDIKKSPNGGYYALGYSATNDGDVSNSYGMTDYWLLRLDDLGNLIWNKSYGGAFYEFPHSLAIAPNNDIIMCGLTNSNNGMAISNHGSNDVFIVRCDSAGNLLWSQCYGGTDSDKGYSVEITSDGLPIITGVTTSTDGDVTFNHGGEDLWVLKLSDSPIGVNELNQTIFDLYGRLADGKLSVAFNSKTTEAISIQLTDLLGKKVISENVQSSIGKNEFEFSCNTTTSIYILRLKFKSGVLTKKIF